MAKTKNDYYWELLQVQVQERRIKDAFGRFRRKGFEPVLIKGWAAARNYPQPSERLAVDIDLAVDPNQFEACREWLANEKIAGVDLHGGLRHLDTLGWEDLFAGSRLVETGETGCVRVLRAEDHLRILCVHWLTDGGAHLQRLWDIYHAVGNRPKNFDWDRCLGVVSRRRRKWIVSTIGLAEKYLGLDIKDTPVFDETKNLPRWLLETVEREWRSEVKLKPLENCLSDKKEFFEQIKIRIPPNSIQSTVEMEGEFDEGIRIKYQIGSVLLRVKPSVKRMTRRLWANRRGRRR